MFELEYGEAAVEVLDILDNTDETDVSKIPQSFISFLVNIASEDYEVDFDHTQPVSQYNLKEKTRELLGYIYINWWCDKEEKEKYLNKAKEYERVKQVELSEKYNIDKVFESRSKKYSDNIQQNNLQTDNFAVVEYKENIIKKLFSKIMSYFKK